jgi:hypothetical protein
MGVVSLYDGLSGPPIFCGLLVDQRAVGSGGFVLRLLLFVSLLFGWCFLCWRCKCLYVQRNRCSKNSP